jgi:hypothetical protein
MTPHETLDFWADEHFNTVYWESYAVGLFHSQYVIRSYIPAIETRWMNTWMFNGNIPFPAACLRPTVVTTGVTYHRITHTSSFPQSLNLPQFLHCCNQLNVTVLSRTRPCYHISTLPCRTPLRIYST